MSQHCDILLQADHILTQDPDRTILQDGGIAIAGSKIVAVGKWQSIIEHYRAPVTKRMGKKLLMPGLINAHTHSAMTLLRGVADDLPLMEWLTKHIFPVEQHLTPKEVQLGATLACAEMLRYGITSFYDMYLHEDATFTAADATGIRCTGGEGIFMFPSPAYPDVEAAYQLVREQHAKWKNHPRISTAVTPHAVYTSTPEILTDCKLLAEELDAPLHIHLAETPIETAQCLEMHGKRPVPYVNDLGLLTPRTTIAHAVDLTDEELDIIADSGAIVAHNPESNMKLASGIARIPEMLEKGIPVALGTDGTASNNALNMFTEMTTCAMLHKVHSLNPECIPAQTVLDMATLGGAKSLGRTDLGSIAVGMTADIIALDITAPNMQPFHNPVSHAVYAANGSEVCMTMVHGNIIYEEGTYRHIDYPKLLSEMQELKHWVQDKTNT